MFYIKMELKIIPSSAGADMDIFPGKKAYRLSSQ